MTTELRYFHELPKQSTGTNTQINSIKSTVSDINTQMAINEYRYARKPPVKRYEFTTTAKVNNLQQLIDDLPDIVQSDWDTTDESDMSYIRNKPNVPILDLSGQIPASYLPSYVDDILEYPTFADLPQPGEPGKIYVTIDNDLAYRWSGNTYVEISKSIVTGVKGNAETNYRIGNINLTAANIGLGNVVNIDLSKAIKSITRSGTTFTYTCLDGTTGTFTQQDTIYTLPAATAAALGGIKVGYTTSGKNYKVLLDSSNNAYVNVPWTDTTYTLPLAAANTRGGVKIGFTTSAANRNYAVQLSNELMYVNVPWTDNNTTYSAGTGLQLTNTAFSVKLGYTTSGNNRAVQADTNGNLYVTLKDDNTTYSAGTGLSLTNTTFALALTKKLVTDALGYTPPTLDTTYNFSGISFTSGLSNTGEHNANNITSNGVWYYTSNGPATSLGASTNDGALYSQAYSTSWVGLIALDYRNGRLFVRGKNNNTWQNWLRVALTGESQPASDVYSWAKASTKPSYTLDEVSDGSTRKLANYLPLAGGTMTGALTVKLFIFGYNYNHAGSNAPAFVFDKPGSNYTGIGAHSTSDTIWFGAATLSNGEASWVDSYKLKWVFNGTVTADRFYGPLTGNVTGNADTATSAGNADTVDNLHASNFARFFLSPMTDGAPADSAKSWFTGTMPSASGAIIYNVPGAEKTIIAGKSSGAYGHMLQLNYNDNYLRLLRYQAGSWKTTDWEKISAGYADSAGDASTLGGTAKSGLLTAFSLGSDGNNTTSSITVGGTTKTGSVTVPYASRSTILNYSSQVNADTINGFLEANCLKACIFTSVSGLLNSNGILISGGYSNTTYGFLLAIDDDPNWGMALRLKSTNWGAWKKIPMGDGTNASGTWGIDITGSAGSVSWSNVTGKPTIPTKTSQLTNDSGFITGGSFVAKGGDTMTGQLTMSNDSYIVVARNGKGITFGSNSTNTYIGADDSSMYICQGKNLPLRFLTNNGELMRIWQDGKVAIGTANALSTFKFFVLTDSTNKYAGGSSAWSNTSDIRKKDVISDIDINIQLIAQAPLFCFKWKDPELDTDVHVGSSAQYWQTVIPESIAESGDGTLLMEYGVTALASAITVAREVVELDKKIKLLEEENKQLKEELLLLKSQINDILATINKSTDN